MSYIRTILSSLKRPFTHFTLTTPVAILLSAIIIGVSIVVYGYVSKDKPVEKDFVKRVAKELKLKGAQWETCLADPVTMNQILTEQNGGIQAGVQGTPTTFVLLKKNNIYEVVATIEGAQNESYLRAALDQALSGNASTTPFKGPQIGNDDFIQGAQSNVLVLEYADAECPYCIRFHPTITSVMASYGDRVGFAFRHYPLSQIHQNANRYGVAIECAGKLKGKDTYFSFIDKLLTEQAESQ